MRYLFDSRQLLQAATDLEETAREKGWSKDLKKKCNDIDREMTNIMFGVENECAPS